jgi:hypothetical protein
VSQKLTITRQTCLRAPRQGNSWEEYEDAHACNSSLGRFAIADGASESLFAGEWALELCESFVADGANDGKVGPWLDAARTRWQARIGEQPDLWHVAEKMRDGSFATFLGVATELGAPAGRWRAIAVGDSCLFLVRGGRLAGAFPVDEAAAFGTRPPLIGSHAERRIRVAGAHGDLAEGDSLFLMTDALAEWFLAGYEAGRTPWRELAGLAESGFAAWVAAERKVRRLKNDDVTLLTLELGVTNT